MRKTELRRTSLTTESTNALLPAVVFIPNSSAVPMTSLTNKGIPCNWPRIIYQYRGTT